LGDAEVVWQGKGEKKENKAGWKQIREERLFKETENIECDSYIKKTQNEPRL
jgi:hypothetical protein